MSKIVIIGASFAGCSAAKELLSLKENVDLTIISPSKSVLYSVAVPRVLVEPNLIDDIFLDVSDQLKGIANEKGHKLAFIQASVQEVDFEAKTVHYTGVHTGSVSYNKLIISSGSSTKEPVKLNDTTDHAEVRQRILDLAQSAQRAKTIAVIGGGATGIEIAGELAYEKSANVTLILSSSKALSGYGDSISKSVERKLKALNVDILFNKKVQSEIEGKVNFTDGSSRSFDLVISAYGYTPNTQFLKQNFLDENSYIKVDEHLRIPGHKDVFVYGDVVSGSLNSIIDIEYFQSPVLKSWIKVELCGAPESSLKTYTKRKISPFIVVPISREGGVMYVYGFSLPSFLVRYLKASTYMIERFASFF